MKNLRFNAVLTSHYKLFTVAASKILGVNVFRVEVRRHVGSGPLFDTLTVYVYRMDDEDKQYYHMDNGAKIYQGLSRDFDTFKKALEKRK